MDHRDQHRHPNGRFKPRPGAKGFKPLEPPKKDAPESKKPNTLALWVERNRSSKP